MARRLPNTAWAVLGVLAFDRELSGYMVKQWADHGLSYFHTSPAISQIYSELKRLEELGYVHGRDIPEEQRTTRVYRISATGKKALRAWLEQSPVELPVLKHGVMLRLWLGHLSNPDQLRDVVKQYQEELARMVDDLRSDERKALQDDAFTYPAIVIRWGDRYYRNELKQMDALLKELDRLET